MTKAVPPIANDHVRNPWEPYSSRGVVFRDEHGFFDRFDKSGANDNLPIESAYYLEIKGSDAVWRRMNGPLVPSIADVRAFVIMPFFPRDQKSLSFRVVFSGQTPVEFSAPNPEYKPVLPTWQTTPKPWRKDLGPCAVSISKWERFSKSRRGISWANHYDRMLCDFRIESLQTSQSDDAWKIHWGFIKDPWGNSAETPYVFPIDHRPKLLTAKVNVHRSDRYRWSLDDVSLLGNSTWEGASITGTIEITDQGRALGIKDIAVRMVDDNMYGDFAGLRRL